MSYRIGPVSLAAVLAAAAALPSSAAAAPAVPRPTNVVCGAVITHSVTLARNVSCSSSQTRPALTVDAPNITINLNGFTVTTVNHNADTTGILDSGYDGVTITDGTLEEFNQLVLVRRASNTDLDGLTGAGTGQGDAFYIRGGTDNTIADSNVSALAAAIDVVDSSHVLITDTTSETDFGGSFGIDSNHAVLRDDTGGADGPAYYITGSDNQIIDSQAQGNNKNGPLEVASGTHNLVEGGTFTSPASDGIDVDSGAVDTTIKQTTDDENAGAGISTDSASTRLIDNTADNNERDGIVAVPGVYAVGNEASGNGTAQCVNISCS
jgi:Right handed beta helix region